MCTWGLYLLVQLLISQLTADYFGTDRGYNIFAYIHYMTQVVDRYTHTTDNKGQVLAVDHWLCGAVALQLSVPHDNSVYELSPVLALA